MQWFSIALRLKNFWLVLQNDGIWHDVIANKYLKKLSVETWLRGKHFNFRGASVFWKGFLLTLPWLGKSLSRQVGCGNNVFIGIDPIIGVQDFITFPASFKEFLEDLDITSLSQAHNTLLGSHRYWYTAEDLCVAGDWKLIWDSFMRSLEIGGIHLDSQPDILLWDYNKHDGSITAKLVYNTSFSIVWFGRMLSLSFRNSSIFILPFN